MKLPSALPPHGPPGPLRRPERSAGCLGGSSIAVSRVKGDTRNHVSYVGPPSLVILSLIGPRGEVAGDSGPREQLSA